MMLPVAKKMENNILEILCRGKQCGVDQHTSWLEKIGVPGDWTSMPHTCLRFGRLSGTLLNWTGLLQRLLFFLGDIWGLSLSWQPKSPVYLISPNHHHHHHHHHHHFSMFVDAFRCFYSGAISIASTDSQIRIALTCPASRGAWRAMPSTAKHQNQTSDPSAKWPQANLFCKSEILQNLEVILTLTLSTLTIATPSAQGSWKLHLALSHCCRCKGNN